jgi:hypothetical protein
MLKIEIHQEQTLRKALGEKAFGILERMENERMNATEQVDKIRDIVQNFYDADLYATEAIERVAGVLGMGGTETIFCPYHGDRTRAMCEGACPLEPNRCKAYMEKWGKK